MDITSVALADGSLLELDPSISFTLSPSGGTALEAGTDFGVIYAETAVAEVPEPNSFRLLIVGLFLLLLFRLSIFAKSRTNGDAMPQEVSPNRMNAQIVLGQKVNK